MAWQQAATAAASSVLQGRRAATMLRAWRTHAVHRAALQQGYVYACARLRHSRLVQCVSAWRGRLLANLDAGRAQYATVQRSQLIRVGACVQLWLRRLLTARHCAYLHAKALLRCQRQAWHILRQYSISVQHMRSVTLHAAYTRFTKAACKALLKVRALRHTQPHALTKASKQLSQWRA